MFVVLQPIAGALSDRIGRRKLLIFFGIGGTVLTVPIMTMLAHTTNPLAAFGLMMGALVIITGYTSINSIVKAELFPTDIRALGVGLPYALTVAIFGGTAEIIALALKKAGHESLFFWYVAGCVLISLDHLLLHARDFGRTPPSRRQVGTADAGDTSDADAGHRRTSEGPPHDADDELRRRGDPAPAPVGRIGACGSGGRGRRRGRRRAGRIAAVARSDVRADARGARHPHPPSRFRRGDARPRSARSRTGCRCCASCAKSARSRWSS